MRVAISACLLGRPVRYDGGTKPNAAVRALADKVDALPVCPETASGLPVPRPPAEQQPDGRVLLRGGTDVTSDFARGSAHEAARVIAAQAPLAVLKAKSPSCGHGVIYDGTYTGTLTKGEGTFARLLVEEGICVVDENVVKSCKPSVEHPVAIVLGSGLGHLQTLVKPVRRIDYHDIEDFPEEAQPVAGHRFEATVGTVDGVPVVVYPGRIHLYQGYTAGQVTCLVRHAHRLGCHDIIFACATGAVEGLRDVETPFVDMGEAYSAYLRTIARGVADDLGISVEEGVYAGLLGPSFETPAEVRMLAGMGVSYAGMSTVNEVIMANALGMNVLGLTLATNMAGASETNHQSVLEEAAKHADDFERLVRGVIRLL